MRTGSPRSWLVLIALTAAAVAAGTVSVRRTHRLRMQVAAAVAPPASLPPAGEEAPVPVALREEVRSLHAEIRFLEAEMARAAEAPAPLRLPRVPQPEPASPAPPWSNVGAQSPAAAFETALWAATSGESETLAELVAFDAEAQVQAEAFFQEIPPDARAMYGSAGKLVAAMMAARLPLEIQSAEVVSTAAEADDAVLAVRIERKGRPPTNTLFNLHRENGSWKLLVPAPVVEGYRYNVTGISANAAPPTVR